MGNTVSAHRITTATVSTVSRRFCPGLGGKLNASGIVDLSGLDIIKFGIESKHSCAETSTAAFQREITSALREMRRVCSPEPTYPDPPAVARL